MENITVIGAGNSGLAMAAHLALNGNGVRLWNRSPKNIRDLLVTKCIHSQGLVEGEAHLDLVTSDLQQALKNSNLVLITTPANSYHDIARKMSSIVNSDMFILLNPGRTFGALDFQNTLIQTGCKTLPKIAETQTIMYTCRKIDPVNVDIIAFKRDVLTSSINPLDNLSLIHRLPDCIQSYFSPAKSMIDTSIGNVGMILHCAPVLFNAGWIENPQKVFKYYYDGITPTVAHFLEKLDNERIEVSRIMGSPVESTTEWLKRSYGLNGKNLYECIQNNESYKTIDAPTTLQHRYIFEDVPCGLVPVEALGKRLGLSMKYCGLVIDLASELMDVDLRVTGRTLEQLGLNKLNNDDLIQLFKKGMSFE
jgi:opine dehydrogenase